MSAEDVEQVIIRPMQAVYPTPQHLRGQPAALELALDTYRRGLERYDRPVLERAWQRAAEGNEFWTWPKLADYVKACEQIRKSLHPSAAAADVRVDRANDLANAYTNRFMESSQLAKRAMAEGWADRLRQYVSEAAWVQGQLIAGCHPVGYSSALVVGYGRVGQDERREQAEAFLEKAREQAAKGHIRVHVPHTAVEQWKKAAAAGEAKGRRPGDR